MMKVILFSLIMSVLSGNLVATAAPSVPRAKPKCAIFFIPGAFAEVEGGASRFISARDYFSEYLQYFTAKGCVTKKGVFPPDASIEERALILKDQLERFLRDTLANDTVLIAHSQGGLDARFALKTLKLKGVSALLTIGSPHHGTPLADWAIEQREKRTFIYWVLRAFWDYDLDALRFAGEIRNDFLTRLEARFSEVPGVRYAAARGVCKSRCHFGLMVLQKWMGGERGDGVVPGESQAFGADLGEYDLDHISEVGADDLKRAERTRLLSRMSAFLGLAE